MDQISFNTVAIVFQELVKERFPDEKKEDRTDQHIQIAELLFEKLHEISFQYVFMEEAENYPGIWHFIEKF